MTTCRTVAGFTTDRQFAPARLLIMILVSLNIVNFVESACPSVAVLHRSSAEERRPGCPGMRSADGHQTHKKCFANPQVAPDTLAVMDKRHAQLHQPNARKNYATLSASPHIVLRDILRIAWNPRR